MVNFILYSSNLPNKNSQNINHGEYTIDPYLLRIVQNLNLNIIIQKYNQFTMQKYQVIKKLGQGSFGNVDKAQNIQTKQFVAIKKLKKKYGTWEQCLQLSEVKAMRKISHPNVIKMKELIRVLNDAYLIFQYLERDLLKLINDRKEKGKSLEEKQIRFIAKQITEALCCIHKNGFFHRDLKPQNILIGDQLQAKIIDFGIAKEMRSKPPFTEYISTRWYRAPELLFRFPTYSAPVDVFALGCLVAEMYLKKPLFQGNSQMDQISKLCSILGSPTMDTWPDGFKHAAKKGINFPQFSQISLQSVLPECPKDALDFISQCLRWDPLKRITAAQLTTHPFLQVGIAPIKTIQQNAYLKPTQEKQKIKRPSNTKNYLDKDDQFDQLIRTLQGNKITSSKNIHEEEDDW